MRVVLHIGMPKSGTSALQKTLRTNQKLLRQNGIFYPAGHGLPKNHNLLATGFLADDELPRIFAQVYGDTPQRRFADIDALIDKILRRAGKGSCDGRARVGTIPSSSRARPSSGRFRPRRRRGCARRCCGSARPSPSPPIFAIR